MNLYAHCYLFVSALVSGSIIISFGNNENFMLMHIRGHKAGETKLRFILH
jgi:hypothetical protein